MTRKRRRLYLLLAGLASLAVATTLVLLALQSNLAFFYSPSEVAAQGVPEARRFRLGGLVEPDSVKRQADGVTVEFRVTDTRASLPVRYKGVLPDLFREGQGVVAEGMLQGGVFQASEVLAKHDENYMPPEVAKALKASGRWKEGEGK
ncbi:MAG: cytochrome c maturation protein CcmE [Proteobacteria bacterium]|nr:cytochrome c maturation protein CcmE [Pseudomonadota bacterium]